MEGWLSLAERFGLPLLGLGLLILFLWRSAWPMLKSRLELADKLILDQANESKRLLETTIREFGEQLHKSNEVSERVADHLEALTDEIRSQKTRR